MAKMNKMNMDRKLAGKDPYDNVIRLQKHMEEKEELEKKA